MKSPKIYNSRCIVLFIVLHLITNLLVEKAKAQTIEPQQLFTIQAALMPELANNGNYQVGVRTVDVVNPDQLNLLDFKSKKDRPLKVEVWYPASPKETNANAIYENVTRAHKRFSVSGEAYRDAPNVDSGNFPLIVLSHGYTGYRSIMFYLGEHLASHGYIVLGIDHTDSTNAEVDFKNNPGSGFVSTLINRSRDQQFVLDYFSNVESPLGAIIDGNNAAVIGYSMGGYGAINTVGGCYDYKSTGLQKLGFPVKLADSLLPKFNFCNAGRETVDPRWKAMVAIAPWGQELNVHQADSLANIAIPTFYIAGEEDDIVAFEKGVKKLFEQTNAQNNYMMVYENARHNIAPHPAPYVAYASEFELGHYIETSWNNELLTRINEHMILAFLDCHMKGNQKRCSYLPIREDITQEKQSDGKLSEPWPGFANRWGTGVKFYRDK